MNNGILGYVLSGVCGGVMCMYYIKYHTEKAKREELEQQIKEMYRQNQKRRSH